MKMKVIDSRIMTIKDKQKASLDVLVRLNDFCQEHGIRCYLAYGTLLGAIRHQGFIPWDDDVDVFVPRPEYEFLLRNYQDDTGLTRIVSNISDKGYLLPYAKIENTQTVRIVNSKRDTHGIGIDIFPLDGLPEDLIRAEAVFQENNRKFINVLARFQTYRARGTGSVVNTATFLLERILEKTGVLNNLSLKISKNIYNTDYNSCNKVACVTGMHSGKFRAFDREWFEPEWTAFAGYTMCIPKGYDHILSMVYGDYMTPPPEDGRASTHSDIFMWSD